MTSYDTPTRQRHFQPPADVVLLPPRRHATSTATRLLCAGTYLDPVFRKAVIKELLTNWWRTVPPAYGYDAVSVLAHALAADRLRRKQIAAVSVGSAATIAVAASGIFGSAGNFAPLLIPWLLWAAGVMRRVATLQTLATRLRPAQGDDDQGVDGSYPASNRLTANLVAKISIEQDAAGGPIYYGGFTPFVGAGVNVYQWSNAELLIEAPPPKRPEQNFPGAVGTWNGDDPKAAEKDAEARKIKSFKVQDITDYVAERMAADLRDNPPLEERIDTLVVEKRTYSKATGEMPASTPQTPGAEPVKIHWREDYDAAREYLCVRVGSWNQELVTSMFVGFDVKGNTLHTEFYTYVLAPIIESFHLVDRLPAEIGGKLIARVGWDVLKGSPVTLWRMVTNPIKVRLPKRKRRGDKVRVQVLVPADNSQFRFGRYASTVVDRGAYASVREMAVSEYYHHFFQESDADKYKRIVERRLLQIIEDFLIEHNVDLTDHRAHQANVLQQNFGNNNNFANGTFSVDNKGTQNFNAPTGN